MSIKMDEESKISSKKLTLEELHRLLEIIGEETEMYLSTGCDFRQFDLVDASKVLQIFNRQGG